MAQTRTKPEKVYSDPELRERLKRKIKRESRGGAAGTWTLRKSALLAHDYEEAGGGYRTRTRTSAQKGVRRALERVSDSGQRPRRRTGRR